MEKTRASESLLKKQILIGGNFTGKSFRYLVGWSRGRIRLVTRRATAQRTLSDDEEKNQRLDRCFTMSDHRHEQESF